MGRPITWLARLVRVLMRPLRRRRVEAADIREVQIAGIERIELVTAEPPRSLDDLCLRLSLGDWAAAAPNREFSLIRRSR